MARRGFRAPGNLVLRPGRLTGPGSHFVEATTAYLARDRHEAMALGQELPRRMRGAALFADISGFTPLTEALTRALGPRRGVEELTRHLNRVYDALVDDVHRYGGSIINFAGDAITCWFDGDAGSRAIACGLAMQEAMGRQPCVEIPGGAAVPLSLKVGVAAGEAGRFAVGDASIQVLDVLAGALLAEMAAAANAARKGEVVVTRALAVALAPPEGPGLVTCRSAVADAEEGVTVGVVQGLSRPVQEAPWGPGRALPDDVVRPWLLPAVFERLATGRGEFLTELRPAVALFLKFTGLDYDGDERAGAKLDRFVRWIQRVVSRYGGYLHHVSMGDKGSYLYGTFGAPIAHEDDAERALTAALELRVPPRNLGFDPAPRIGISQGALRTGAYGGGARRTYGVLGDEMNLAARLMEHAQSGEVLVSGHAREVGGDRFAWEPVLPLKLKGKVQAVPVFRLVDLRTDESVSLLAAGNALPMVGRKEELARIVGLLAQARAGRGQVIEIVAEAGMGKSRLVAEVVREAHALGYHVFGGQAQSFGTNSSYLAWWGVWRAFFALPREATLEEQAAGVGAQLLEIRSDLLPRLPLLGGVLNLTLPENATTRTLDAKLRKSSLESLLVECLRHRAERGPLLIVLEDAHWLDPLSRDLLDVLARGIAAVPVTLLLATRPAEVGWEGHGARADSAGFTEVRLGELSTAEAEQLIHAKLAQMSDHAVDPDPAVVQRLVERSQGNPFYLEELINLLRDQGRDPNDPRAWEGLELPNSLQSLILSRVDRLSERQKPTLKVASVIGRVFEPGTISAIYPSLLEAEVREDLTVLERMELTAMERPEPDLAFLFKHVVTQEVAYETLSFATRARLHGELGAFLERRHAGGLDRQLDLLAFHFDRSDREAKRCEYLVKAGHAAQARYANAAALSYFRRALPLLSPPERVPVQLSLGRVLETVGDWPGAAETYRGALSLAETLADRLTQARARTALAELHRKQGAFAEATQELDAARALFEAVGDVAGVAQTLHSQGSVMAQQGDYDEARRLYFRSLETRRSQKDSAGVASLLSNLGIIAWFQGDLAQARKLHEESLGLRRELGDRWAIGNSLNNLALVMRDLGAAAEARQLLEECAAINREVGDRWSIANTLGSLADVALSQGDHAAARAFLIENVGINRDLGDRAGLAFSLEFFSRLAAASRQPERALRLAGAAARVRSDIGAPLSPSEQDRLDRSLAHAAARLDSFRQAALFGEGRALALPQAIALALEPEGQG